MGHAERGREDYLPSAAPPQPMLLQGAGDPLRKTRLRGNGVRVSLSFANSTTATIPSPPQTALGQMLMLCGIAEGSSVS